jgi:hypothetical protein
MDPKHEASGDLEDMKNETDALIRQPIPEVNKVKINETNMRWLMLTLLCVLRMGPYFCSD